MTAHTTTTAAGTVEVKPDAAHHHAPLALSVIIPCLNEAKTIAGCVDEARTLVRELGLPGEVIVADNGSTDGSRETAAAHGARVVPVPARGYGAALRAGILASRGRTIVMGDADGSYDFREALPMVQTLLESRSDLVMGDRFGGRIEPGAMPFKNRYLGNPVLSWIGRTLFDCPVRDFHCGMRAFTREAFDRLDVRSQGMELASDMVMKASLRGMRITQSPITLRRDGRDRPPHLRPWRDGWRHLRFMLSHSPRFALLLPGLVLLALGLSAALFLSTGARRVAGVGLDIHSLIAACLAILLGHQWLLAACVMRLHGVATAIGPAKGFAGWMLNRLSAERLLATGGVMVLLGLVPMGWLIATWARADFGPLDTGTTLRPTMLGFTLIALGGQTVMSGVVASMLSLARSGNGA